MGAVYAITDQQNPLKFGETVVIIFCCSALKCLRHSALILQLYHMH